MDKEQSSEGFYLNEKGEKADELFHEEMLASPEGQKAFYEAVIRDALRSGMDLEKAKLLFGDKPH